MILTIAPNNTRTDFPPTKERKHSHEKGYRPDKTNDISDTSRGNDGVVTEGVIYRCKGIRQMRLNLGKEGRAFLNTI